MKQSKKLIGLLLAVVMLLSMVPVTFADVTNNFPDFPTGWSEEAMTAAVNNGLLNGFEDGKIYPEANLTRAQFAAIMVRAFGAKAKANISNFEDVPVGAWYYDDIAKAVKMGALNGQSANEMAPDSPITRQEAFTAFARILVLSDEDISVLNKFNDKGEIASWAINHVAALTQRGYVNGDPVGNVNPGALISREEFAQLMHNSIRTYITKPGVYTEDLEGITVIRVGDVTLKGLNNSSDLVIGDGVGEGKIILENVTIGKRLLVRGAGVVKVVKSTLGDYVVVNNVNGVTKFDNYRSEEFFKDIVENTKAEFKKSGLGGGYTGSSEVTVTFYNHYSTDSELEIKTVSIEKGTTVAETDFPDKADYVRKGYAENSSVAPVYDTEWTHTITPDFWYVKDGVLTPFDKNVVVNGDTNVYLLTKSLTLKLMIEGKLDTQQISADYNSDTRLMNTVKDLLVKSGRNKIDFALGTPMLSGYVDKVVNKLVSTGIIDNDKKVQVVDVPIKISTLIKRETIDDMVETLIRDSIEDEGKFSDLYDHLDIKDNADKLGLPPVVAAMSDEQIKSYVNGLTPSEKHNFADKLVDVIKNDAEYKKFVNSLMNDDKFEINKSNASEIAIVKKAIKELTLDEALAESTNSAVKKLVDAIGKDKFETDYIKMRNAYCDGLEDIIDEVIDSSDDDIKKSYTTALTYKLNIFDIYEKVYGKAKDKVIEKLNDANLHYGYGDDDNKYLTFLVDHDIIKSLFDGNSSLANGNFTGYSLKDEIKYYDYLMMLLIVGDDALTWYGDKANLSDEEFAILYDAIFDKIFIAHEKVNEILKAFKEDGELPSNIQSVVEGIDKLNNLILKYGDKAKTLIGKYLDSDINIKFENGTIKDDEKILQLVDVLVGKDNPRVTIDSIYALLYTYNDNIQEKLKSVVKTDKFKQAINKFESTSIGELFKVDGQSGSAYSLYEMFCTLADEGIDAFKVPSAELEVTDIDIYKIPVGKVTMTVQRSFR